MEIFKIRSKEGLYWDSKSFTKLGKEYLSIYEAKTDFNKCKILSEPLPKGIDIGKTHITKIYPLWAKDCEIVKFELIEKEIRKIE